MSLEKAETFITQLTTYVQENRVALENGDTELQLNPSCLRYLTDLNETYGVDARSRMVAPLRGFGPMRVREIQALLKFLSTLKLLKVTQRRAVLTLLPFDVSLYMQTSRRRVTCCARVRFYQTVLASSKSRRFST